MADNYLENQYEQYQARKAAWERERKYGKKRNRYTRVLCHNKPETMLRPTRKKATTAPLTSIQTTTTSLMTNPIMLHTFHTPVTDIPLPEKFTYPFCYTPHPLCIAAAKEVQNYLNRQDRWKEELAQGKMFGVLVVETEEGETGYLAAFRVSWRARMCTLSLCRPCTTYCSRRGSSK